MDIQMIAPCLFGLEGLVADELKRMNMKEVKAEDGRVFFKGSLSDIPRANVRLRCAERVLVQMGPRFRADSFDALFEGVKAIPWETFVPQNGAFPVKGSALRSALHSIPDCQKIVKKAIAERLKGTYGISWFPEDGPLYQVQFFILKDEAVLAIDTSGAGLHKRGWRAQGVTAPLRETLAAGLVNLSRYRGKGAFCDPFCGSGTIVIEAALAAANKAPGLGRTFAAQAWSQVPPAMWDEAREEARALEFHRSYEIWGSDHDPKAVEIARSNAKKAGVEDLVRFTVADIKDFAPLEETGRVVTNPPYGQRLLEQKEAEALYRQFGQVMRANPGWEVYAISSHEGFEGAYGRGSDKKRKLYNGMIKCNLYQYKGH